MNKWLSILDSCSGVCTDTRQITKDCLYISLKGANFNGNAFAQQAIENGAKYAIVDEQEFSNGQNVLYVEDGLAFLQQLALAHRQRFDIPIIGITGSNGKTSTKELVKCVLETKFNVLCTEGNLNNHIGVPLTLLRLKPQHEIAIIEMGANKPFDIDELCKIALPTLGIITNIGKAHLEGFINFDGVLKTKSELYDHVKAINGQLFVNADDAILLEAASRRHIKLNGYGEQNGELRGEIAFLDPYVHFRWTYQDYSSPIIDTQMVGKYNFYNFLAALRIGVYFEIEPDLLNAAVAQYVPTNKRSQVEKTNANTVIVDCYNANPSSMASALSSFIEMQHNQKLIIIGDMLELGADGPQEHQKILDFISLHQLKAYTVGPIFKSINPAGFLNTEALKSLLAEHPIQDHLILLKGSRGIALETVLENL
ncbi:MAG: UDP-N-acetylmuramoyl-tripeptide--D-alanyl-D-alanine ligase [Flavobacteriales bacterium]